MVVYDLICSRGHRFEGWFSNLEDLEDQLGRKLIACPVCGDENPSRLPSTFGLVKSGRPNLPEPVPPQAAGELTVEAAREFFKRWQDFSEQLEREYDDVGPRFTEEALKMHYGVADRRNIRGLSTATQEEMLRKEGVDFLKFPLLARKTPPSSDN